METFALLEEKAQVKDEWRSATMVLLGLCVMTTGMNMMLKLSADSWDTVLKVSWKLLQQSQLSQVVCLLGSIPVKRAGFGNGSGMIVLDDLDCSGSEGSLFDCPSDSPVLVHDCDHSEDAGVRCLCRTFPPVCFLVSRFLSM